MNFLQPGMLWALPAVLLPIAIHLIHRKRQRVVEWGAMMFLLQGAKLSRGMQRLRHFLLLTLRTLAVAGLIIGIGRPIAGGWLGGMGGGRPDTVLILLDRSASMGEQPVLGGPSKLELGVERIAGALANVDAGRLACIDSVSLEVTELTRAQDLIGLPLGTPTDSQADMPAMLEVAAEHLEINAAGRAELWICSDGQVADWRPDEGRWPALETALGGLTAGVRVNVLHFDERADDNLSLRVTRIQRVEGAEQPELALDLEVRAGAGAEQQQRVPIAVDLGGARSQLQVELQGGAARLVGHRLALDADASVRWGFVELPPDRFPGDNRFYFTFGADNEAETVVVAEDDSIAEVLRIAAEAPSGDEVRCTARRGSALDPDLEGAALLIWAAPLPEGEPATRIERFLERGGQVLCLPPAEPGTASFAGCSWGAFIEPGPELEDRQPTYWRQADDLLRDGQDGTPLPLAQLEISRLSAIAGDVTRLSGLAGGEPLLSRAPTSRGGLYFLGTTPAVADSNLANQGIVLVALVQRALEAALEVAGAATSQEAGRFVPLVDAFERVSETSPDWLLSEALEYAGVVSVGATREVGAAQELELVALNRPESEDRSETMSGERLEGLLPSVDVQLVGGSEESGGLVEEIWRIFLILLLIALIGEALLCVTEGGDVAEVRA